MLAKVKMDGGFDDIAYDFWIIIYSDFLYVMKNKVSEQKRKKNLAASIGAHMCKTKCECVSTRFPSQPDLCLCIPFFLSVNFYTTLLSHQTHRFILLIAFYILFHTSNSFYIYIYIHTREIKYLIFIVSFM